MTLSWISSDREKQVVFWANLLELRSTVKAPALNLLIKVLFYDISFISKRLFEK